MLKAAKEQPLYHAQLDILKLANPVGCYVPYLSKMDNSLRLGKHPRVRKTVPKQPRESLTDEQNHSYESDNESPIFHTPPNTPPSEKRLKRTRPRVKETPTGSRSLEDGFPFSDESEYNYRRFSSRKRKQTVFLGVGDDEEEEKNGSCRKRRASRRLVYTVEPTEQQAKDHLGGLREEIKIQVSEPHLVQREAEKEDGDGHAIVDVLEEKAEEVEPVAGEDKDHDNASSKPSVITRAQFEERFPIGTMVWGKLPGYSWWPGIVISYGSANESKDEPDDGGESDVRAWIKWYGETQLSKIAAERLVYFHEFKEYFQSLQLKGTYKKAIFAAIKYKHYMKQHFQEAAKRCKATFLSSAEDKNLRWIISENSPVAKLITEQENSQATEIGHEDTASDENADRKDSLSSEGNTISSSKGKSRGRGRRGRGRGDKMGIRLTALEQEMIEWAQNGFLPGGKEGLQPATEEREMHVQVVPVESMSYERGQDDLSRKKRKVMMLQVRSKARFDSVLEGRAKLSDMCIGCGDLNVITDHPFFLGGLCVDCKNDFMETTYLFDEDGSQMYCTICSGGEEVFMCDADNCSKVYCGPCVEKLCGNEELDRVKNSERWLCYMCSPEHSHVGLLEKREDWDQKLRELFLADNEMEYEPPTFYQPVPAEERKPIRVLGLFDGIATGLVVLKELGLEVAKYCASEIDIDAVFVSMVQHKEIEHLGDIASITEKEIRTWGPFDLVIGGSPCNDLSVVNPARKGIYEGTGRLFFEFYRILNYAKPAAGEDRPFFWLFENVVSMKPSDKQTISRFLQCNPVVVDARDISPAHRARYFWGNLPGMNRPTIALPSDRLTLQSCLEPNCFRVAQFTKLRTITTKMNSIKQTKKAIFPVRFQGSGEEEQGDVLWCTEMERLFGFPEHYTDIGNLGRAGRQRLLGKAWSVPVIRHLFSPLKEYFKSSTTREGVIAVLNGCKLPVEESASENLITNPS